MAVCASVDTVARTIAGEARGCGFIDMVAVGAVIRERVLRPGWWGSDWQTVCRKPWQFSCWNKGDPNLRVILHAEIECPDVWPLCVAAAHLCVNHLRDRDVSDLFGTEGPFPTHYHDRSIGRPDAWAECEVVQTPWNSAFIFYRGILGMPGRRKG